jgi:hypothetical protein
MTISINGVDMLYMQEGLAFTCVIMIVGYFILKWMMQ